jgi:hypothetical protein
MPYPEELDCYNHIGLILRQCNYIETHMKQTIERNHCNLALFLEMKQSQAPLFSPVIRVCNGLSWRHAPNVVSISPILCTSERSRSGLPFYLKLREVSYASTVLAVPAK